MTDKISEKDKKDWDEFISSRDKLFNKDSNLKKRYSLNKISIDLHGFSIDQANKIIEDFIIKCYEQNIRKIICITGKGLHSQNEKNPYVSKDLSILRFAVPEFILKNKNLMKIVYEIEEANIEDGGAGAIYIYLKKFVK